MKGHDFDLCEEQFAQLDDDDRVKFELVAPPPPPPRVKVCIKPDARPAVNVREALFAFHKQHYSANAMRLVVVGREDLDTLEAWVAPATNESTQLRLLRSERSEPSDSWPSRCER